MPERSLQDDLEVTATDAAEADEGEPDPQIDGLPVIELRPLVMVDEVPEAPTDFHPPAVKP